MKAISEIKIIINPEEGTKRTILISIVPKNKGPMFDAEEDAEENNEARFQIVESFFYDYEISDNKFILGDIGSSIVQQHQRYSNVGTIAPNIYVGTIEIPVLEKATRKEVDKVALEVQSAKTGYRKDYRTMLEDITEKSTDLLLSADSPVQQTIEVDFDKENETLYQKFAFVKSIIGTDEFSEAIHRVISNPVTEWIEITEEKHISNVGRFTRKNIREILTSNRRTPLPLSHPLSTYGLNSVPEKIQATVKTDSADTSENRFIKFALEEFLIFCTNINDVADKKKQTKMKEESFSLIYKLEEHLQHNIFKGISRPDSLSINSPVLQHKEGYREILRVWLMFDLAAKLSWEGGDDVYKGGKKDVAVLYEYWLFFILLELLEKTFQIDSKSLDKLIEPTTDGLSLQIKQGKHTALEGIYKHELRDLNVKFSYNRSFSGEKNYPHSGSWTTTLRPDYTLSVWPAEMKEAAAEKEELIVHIHFDAKYKVNNLLEMMERKTDEELDYEKEENRKGNYKNADLLKMHAYKDAIRRTGGAYILYPGMGNNRDNNSDIRVGFHEIIPGLGAFSVNPHDRHSGTSALKDFIIKVMNHLVDKTSQREKMAYRVFDIHKEPPADSGLTHSVSGLISDDRSAFPDETFVQVAYYDTPEKREWIVTNKLYNYRAGDRRGSLSLNPEMMNAKFLLLHTKGDKSSGDIWHIKGAGPKVLSGDDLNKKKYPGGASNENYYLVFDIEPVSEEILEGVEWDFRKLKGYAVKMGSPLPFTTNLTELMKCKV